MTDKHAVWLDEERCLGSGNCVEVCPVQAIVITANLARIDDALCVGCGACIAACPQGAIQFVVEGEVIAVEKGPLPAVYESGPVAEVAKPVVTVGSTVAVGQATRAVGQQAGHLLAQIAKRGVSLLEQAAENYVENSSRARGTGSGAQHRERRRRGRH